MRDALLKAGDSRHYWLLSLPMNLPPSKETNARQRLVTGIVVIVIGVAIALVAVGMIPVDPRSINCPLWVLLLVGLLMVCGGLAALAGLGSTASTVLVGLAVTMMAVVFTWVAGWAPSDGISGGIPFLPPPWNRAVGRIAFGIGAVLIWALAVVIWRSCFKTGEKNSGSQHQRE